ncbi:MAG: cytochrome c oxidase subunit II transmembrane domain-containing protein [Legionellales bacterium]
MLNRKLYIALLGFLLPAQPLMAAATRGKYHLYMAAISLCAIIGLLVFGVLIYSLVHHRHSKDYKDTPFQSNLCLELIWSTIPFLILFGLAAPAVKGLILNH